MRLNERLRQARERRGWTLSTLASRTGIRESVLASIESGAFGELPRGLYGRAAVRAYAAEVGLDASSVLDEAAPLLAPSEDPLDGLARVRGVRRRRHREARPAAVNGPCGQPAGVMWTGEEIWHAAGATVVDSLILVAINLGVWLLTSVALGVTPAGAFEHAAPALIALWTLIAGAYFVLLAGIRDATPGALLAGRRRPARMRRPLTLRDSVRRGLHCALDESSIAVQWLIRSASGQHWIRALKQMRA